MRATIVCVALIHHHPLPPPQLPTPTTTKPAAQFCFSSLRFMASVNTVAAQHRLRLLSCPRTRTRPRSKPPSLRTTFRTGLRRTATAIAAQDLDVLPVQSADSTDHQTGVSAGRDLEDDGLGSASQVGGFAYESRGIGGGGGGGFSPSPPPDGIEGEEDVGVMVDRAINATIVLAAGTFAITKLLTIDSDYWHGWTIFEILRYAPLHNWYAYEEALKANPVLAKMMISGVVYSVGDWIAQCYEGKPLFDFDRARMFRSGLVGFTLHGSLSHYYYRFCEVLFPFHDWWVVPAKVVFDQTVWSAIWNSIYFVTLGLLRLESPANIYSELKATFIPMLTAGWKLWPFAHLITYGVVPVEQRLLWVDCVELVWVTILSTYSNEKSEARSSEALAELEAKPQSIPLDEE